MKKTISIKNYFKATPTNILKWLGVLKVILGSTAITTAIEGQPYWSVGILIAGALIDEATKFISEELEDDKGE